MASPFGSALRSRALSESAQPPKRIGTWGALPSPRSPPRSGLPGYLAGEHPERRGGRAGARRPERDRGQRAEGLVQRGVGRDHAVDAGEAEQAQQRGGLDDQPELAAFGDGT